MPVGSIAGMATKIKKIYKNKVSDIMKDILSRWKMKAERNTGLK